MASSTPNISAPLHAFDKTKQYLKVVFQQGKPIMDVDLNDLSEALLAQSTAAITEKMGFGPAQVDYREWALLNADHGAPTSAKNIDNFALSLGKIDTLKGVIDTTTLKTDGLDSKIIFDYGLVLDGAASGATDRQFANNILRGEVSAATATSISDDNKVFTPEMKLTGLSVSRIISPTSTSPESAVNPSLEISKTSAGLVITEGAARLRFTTGDLAGEEREITSISDAGRTINVASAFSATPELGDEYVILPANSLATYRALYNAAQTQAASQHDGLNNLPKLVTYLQAFEEDISSDEDSEIKSSLLGQETTHRTQLKWVVRTALVKMSIDGDSLNGQALSELDTSHMYAELIGDSAKSIMYQGLLDAITNDSENLLSSVWRAVDTDGNPSTTAMLNAPSPVSGITPLHLLGSASAQKDRLIWPFLKSVLLRALDGLNGFNDVQVLHMHHAESKGAAAPNETLSPYFYIGSATNTGVTPLVHARLAVEGIFSATGANETASPASYSAPMRVIMTQADLSGDNAQSRSLQGLNGVLYSATAPVVFPSVAAHMGYVDQALLGLSGLGSSATDKDGASVPSAIDFTPDGAVSSVAQAGYGAGAIKPINPLATDNELDGFVSGSSSYLLREPGDRLSHEVNMTDRDLGWSPYYRETAGLEGQEGGTDLTMRRWDQGPLQASAFIKGLSFRKLAIKTSAHKSADLFTMSSQPPRVSQWKVTPSAPGAGYFLPYYKTEGSTLGIESYGASAANEGENYNVHEYLPAEVTALQPVPLLKQYMSDTNVRGQFLDTAGDRENNMSYGSWNRFKLDTAIDAGLDPAVAPTDLWANRATAMRLRYHVGDFYPGEKDARDVPSNLLVDSLNLFVRVEPLSLTHWMTMPKHQHSILENSLVIAEGIEALLKVSHGLGDTQKLINGSGQPLVTNTSPARVEGTFPQKLSINENLALGDVDPYDLPFMHSSQPFIHWYHPAQNALQMPHPSGAAGNAYQLPDGSSFTATPYPKWGRRSLIVPALVPFQMVSHNLDDHGETHAVPTIAIGPDGNSLVDVYPDSITSNEFPRGIDPSLVTGANSVDTAVLPYVPHASKTTDAGSTLFNFADGTSEFIGNNQVTFPSLYQADEGGYEAGGEAIGPVFLPASRKFLNKTTNSPTSAYVGFNPLLKPNAHLKYVNIESLEQQSFPYDEKQTHYIPESGDNLQEVPLSLQSDFDAWSVPVMRAAIRTRTVAAIVNLVRTSFESGIHTLTLSSEYDYTMPTANVDVTTREGVQTPGIGPDTPADTLFVGDTGTAIGGFAERVGFASPLVLGVGALHVEGGLLNNSWTGQSVIRDAFEAALYYAQADTATQPILNTFWALKKQGLQQKLLLNCSFRVMHHRPSGRDVNDGASSAPKSLTELFLVHDRTNGGALKPLTRPVDSWRSKPFIHLASTHPASAGVNNQDAHPNYAHMSHLYSIMSDSVGGSHDSATYTTSNGLITPNFENTTTQTTAMGDTFAVDPFDYEYLNATTGVKQAENAHNNSGIEIELLSELRAAHDAPKDRGLSGITGSDFDLINTMPTANELTLPGDHELVFVLYTGHYGAHLHDTSDLVDTTHTPSVAGCHLSATIELNRPSERVSSTAQDEHHYGQTINGSPIKVYSLPGTV